MGFYDKYFDIPPYIFFVFNLITVLLSTFLIYKAIKYYKQIRSREYLIIAGIFLRYAYTNFVIIRVIYITNYSYAWFTQDESYWTGNPFIAVWHMAVAAADILILYHINRLIDLSQKQKLKIIHRSVSIIAGLYLLFTILHGLDTFITKNWNAWDINGVIEPNRWFMKFYFPYFVLSSSMAAFLLSGTLVTLLLIYFYLTVSPENQTRPILISRIFWIGFGISRLSNSIIQILIVDYGWLSDDVIKTFDILNTT